MKKEINRILNVAGIARKAIVKNGKEFYKKTVEEISKGVKTPEEKVDFVENILKTCPSADEAIEMLKGFFGLNTEQQDVPEENHNHETSPYYEQVEEIFKIYDGSTTGHGITKEEIYEALDKIPEEKREQAEQTITTALGYATNVKKFVEKVDIQLTNIVGL
jgi:hydroxymethylpyrimidine pyrophosphatase-like HAD family hydrolase